MRMPTYFPANWHSPPWEGQGEVPQVSTPLLGRGSGRLRKFGLPSLGGVGGGYAN